MARSVDRGRRVKLIPGFKDEFLVQGEERSFNYKFLHQLMALLDRDVPKEQPEAGPMPSRRTTRARWRRASKRSKTWRSRAWQQTTAWL